MEMEKGPSGMLKLLDDTEILSSWLIVATNSDDPEERILFDRLSGEVHSLPLVLSAVHSEILMYRIDEAIKDPNEVPSIRDAANELLESLD